MPGLLGYDQYVLNVLIPQLPGYEPFFYLITQLGSSLTLTALGALAAIFGRNRLKAFGIVLLIGMLMAIPLIDDVKDIVKRPRPESAIYYYPLINNNYSFPSGHALSIFLAATLLGAYFGLRFYAAGYVMAAAVSLSRLYLGVHYPSDILGGAVIGIAMGELLAYAAYRAGLYDKPGFISFLPRPANRMNWSSFLSGEMDKNIIPILAIMAIAASILFYYFDLKALTLLFIVLASLLILYILLRVKGRSTKALTLFILISSAIASGYLLHFLGANALSLFSLAISYVLMIALADNGLAIPGKSQA